MNQQSQENTGHFCTCARTVVPSIQGLLVLGLSASIMGEPFVWIWTSEKWCVVDVHVDMVGHASEVSYTCDGTITGTQARVFPRLEDRCGLKEDIAVKASSLLEHAWEQSANPKTLKPQRLDDIKPPWGGDTSQPTRP
eukprot:101798-Prorocentrum_minimum.AAC.1